MADNNNFVRDSINQAQSTPQVITKQEAATFKKEYGADLFNDLLKNNTIAIEENTKAIKDIQSQDRKNAEQTKKQENDKKSLLNTIATKLATINLSYESLTQKQDINNVINKTANGLKTITDKLGILSTTMGIFIDTMRIAAQVSFAANKNQIENNRLYTQLFGFSSLSGQGTYAVPATLFKSKLHAATGVNFDEKDEINPMLNIMAQSYNTANLSENTLLTRLRNSLAYNRVNPNLANIYNTMLGQSGGSNEFILNSMALFAKRFEHNNLGLDKSLQQTKALYESNRRFNMSMGEAAGYIQKFNKQLQDGTLTLQDLTTMKNMVKGNSMGQNAGLGQMLLNAGLGTPKLLTAAGNPAKMAVVLREGGKEELDAIQKLLWDIASSTGLGTDQQAMGETLRDLYSKFGINLSDQQVKYISRGRNYSLQAGALAPSKKQLITNEPKEAMAEVLSEYIKQTTTESDKITNKIKQDVSDLLGVVNVMENDFSNSLNNFLNERSFGSMLTRVLISTIKIFGGDKEELKNAITKNELISYINDNM